MGVRGRSEEIVAGSFLFSGFIFHSEIRWKASTESEDEKDVSRVLGKRRKCEMASH